VSECAHTYAIDHSLALALPTAHTSPTGSVPIGSIVELSQPVESLDDANTYTFVRCALGCYSVGYTHN